jgi:outer membrane protein OmpA-like peptidoglycan-associated protein
MERFLGVKVERVARKYTEVLRIGRDRTGESRLTTLSPGQDVAEIDLFLLQRKHRDGTIGEVKRLHHFTVRNTRKPDGTRPLLSLNARKKGPRTYAVELSKDGVMVEEARVRIPIRMRTILSAVGLVMVLAAVLLAVFTCEPGSIEDTPQREEASSESAPIREEESPPQPRLSEQPRQPEQSTTGPAETPEEPAAATSPPPEEPIRSVPREITRSFTVYFHPDSSRPREGSPAVLDEIAAIMTDNDNTIESVVIEGHTALFGNEAGRERISSGRIDVVEAHLRDAGWVPEDPPERRVLGASAPRTRSMEDQDLNRRAEVTITYRRDER